MAMRPMNYFAAFFSLFLPGMGQFMLNKPAKGALYMIIGVLLWFIFLGWIMHIASCVDAFNDDEDECG